MTERLQLNPKRIGVDLDKTLFNFIGESETTETIQSAEIINKTVDLLGLLRARDYMLAIYTAAFFFRPLYIASTFPDVYSMFDQVYTRESLINDDAPPDALVITHQKALLAEAPAKWRMIEVPPNLSETDKTTVRWVGRNRGKVPALIHASTMIDDGRKVRQIGDESLKVAVIRPAIIPNKDIAIREFARRNFK